MIPIVEFVLARLEEDSAVARDCPRSTFRLTVDPPNEDDEYKLTCYITYWQPNRVIADIATKRNVVMDCAEVLIEESVMPPSVVGMARDHLMYLAAAWVDHPDYDKEW